MEVFDPEEIKAVEAIRAKKTEKKEQGKARLHVLEHAFRYEEWLQKNGMESSYSVFCDNYGYEVCPPPPFLSRRDFYDRIVSVLSMARGHEKAV